ncbi:unnamed protein product [Heligmosomoides polygyrus]|uniref:Protein arginine methyltransferase NDUFAF7 n=1 Tax=Heligmosomoides polygyrus TaxID=6339 RepID=A0A3P7TW15_HELPZ|nr:unnamed protein product [Heligmosomoides polygyrus]
MKRYHFFCHFITTRGPVSKTNHSSVTLCISIAYAAASCRSLYRNACDILTVVKRYIASCFRFQEKSLSVHLVETSDALIKEQERLLCGRPSSPSGSSDSGIRNKTKSGVPVSWYKTIEDVPEQFSVFVANEFLDALPVHQFSRGANGMWNEIYVNIDKANELCFMRSKGENIHTRGLIPEDIREDKERSHWECSPEAGTFSTMEALELLLITAIMDLAKSCRLGHTRTYIGSSTHLQILHTRTDSERLLEVFTVKNLAKVYSYWSTLGISAWRSKITFTKIYDLRPKMS